WSPLCRNVLGGGDGGSGLRQRPFDGRPMQLGDEAIAPAGERFDKPGTLSRIAKGLAQLSDRRVEARLEVAEGVPRPQFPLQLFRRDELARLFHQKRQHLKREPLQTYFPPPFVEFSGAEVYLERVETNSRARGVCVHACRAVGAAGPS